MFPALPIFEGICDPVNAPPLLCIATSTQSFLTLPVVCSTKRTIMQTSAREIPSYRIVLEGCGAQGQHHQELRAKVNWFFSEINPTSI